MKTKLLKVYGVLGMAGLYLLLAMSANAAKPAKINICHAPPGNPENTQSIWVGIKGDAVTDHVAHGDWLVLESEICDSIADNNCDLVPGTQEENDASCDDGDPNTADSCNAEHECVNTIPLSFSGVRTDLPLADAAGWSICYNSPYGVEDANLAANIQSNCDKANVMLACRETGSGVLTMAAHAPRADVFSDTGTGNTPHNANGVDWYFNNNYSMGYSHEGDGISRNSCDTATGAFPEERLCFHTHDWHGRGWRCGTATSLNVNNDWERVVLHAD